MTPDENTLDPRAAKRALEESQAKARHTSAIVEDAQRTFKIVRKHRERNHYQESMRKIMRGGY